MTQLFRYTPEAESFHRVFLKSKGATAGKSLIDFKADTYGSKALGYALYDSEATDFYLRFDRDFFSENYNGIIDAHEYLGTFETYLYLIRAALGQQTVVSFDTPSAGHLIINISEFSILKNAVTISGDQIIAINETGGEDELQFDATTSIYTISQVKTMLESIEAGGVFVEYNFL